jgi:hypothetical protein
MNRLHRLLAAVLVAAGAAAAQPAVAQRLNIDLGPHFATPSNAYGAAANQAGEWNTLGLGVTSNLVGLDGAPTSVSATVTAGTDDGWDDVCPGDSMALLADNIYTQGGTWTVTLTGIANGTYTVYLYQPGHTSVFTGNMTVNGIAVTGLSGHGCTLAAGSNYATTRVTVTNGQLTVVGDSAGTAHNFAGLAGLQLVPASAQPIQVGSISTTRFPYGWTLDGVEMANTRAKLLNPANFGPGGTYPRAIVITDTAAAVGSVTAETLAPFDVFFIGYLEDTDAHAFTAGELAAFQAWVEAGGTMVITCDDSDYDAVCAHFGFPAAPDGPAQNPIVPTAAGAAHPLFNGPFGAIPSVNMTGTRGAFTATAGATILAQDSTAGTPLPAVLVKNVGAGRVILMADVDLLANAASDGETITTNNDRFIGNVFAFAGLNAGNYQGLFWRSPAGLESGWGVNLAHQGNVIFATWFTYDLTGKPWWLAVVAERKGPRVYSGDLFTTVGPPFSAVPFDPALVTETTVGTATFTFTDDDNGTFDYTVNGPQGGSPKDVVTQSKPITRQLFGAPVPSCAWGALTDLTLALNYQDLWWRFPAASESGWGINFTHQGNFIFATWFTYDAAGKPWWLAIVAEKTAPNVYSGNLFTTMGPAFNAVPFAPAAAETTVGTGTFTVVDGNKVIFDYTVGAVTQSKTLTRQVFAEPGTTCN